MLDLKWKLGVLLDRYASRASKLDTYDFESQCKLKNLYSQAILLNTKMGFGIFYPIDDFIEGVRCGSYVDYDGSAELLDTDGNKIGYGRCNVEFLERAKANGAVYVAWFNK